MVIEHDNLTGNFCAWALLFLIISSKSLLHNSFNADIPQISLTLKQGANYTGQKLVSFFTFQIYQAIKTSLKSPKQKIPLNVSFHITKSKNGIACYVLHPNVSLYPHALTSEVLVSDWVVGGWYWLSPLIGLAQYCVWMMALRKRTHPGCGW